MSIEEQSTVSSGTPASQPIAEQPAGSPAVGTLADITAPVAQQPTLTPDVGASSAAGSPAAPADPRAEINSFAETLGVDPAMFSSAADIKSARQAFAQWQDQQTREGIEYLMQSQQPQYPQTPAGTVPQQQFPAQPQQLYQTPEPVSNPPYTVDLKALGIEADDPVAKVIMAMDQRAQQQQQALDKITGHFEAQQKAAKEQVKRERTQKAESTIDNWNSPLYGKSGRRSIAEQARVDQIYQLANYVIARAFARGEPEPSIEQCIARARFQLEQEVELHTPQPTMPQALPSAAAPTPPAPSGLSMMEKWSENPSFMASLPR